MPLPAMMLPIVLLPLDDGSKVFGAINVVNHAEMVHAVGSAGSMGTLYLDFLQKSNSSFVGILTYMKNS